jgi:hypothetical protein
MKKGVIEELKPIIYAVGICFSVFFYMNNIHASAKDFNELSRNVSYNFENQRRNTLDDRLYDLDQKYGEGCERCPPELKRQYDKWKKQLEDAERKIRQYEEQSG